jgi:hypothetical protein
MDQSRKTLFPKQLTMPHYVPLANIYDSFFANVYFLGRWIRKTIHAMDCMYTINMGSALFFKVKGANTVTLGFLTDIYNTDPSGIAYSVDGGPYTRAAVNHAPVVITGLDTNEHWIRAIVYATSDDDQLWDHDQGVAFTGVTADAGIIEAVKPKARIAEFFGDSITAGCWLLSHVTSTESHGGEQNYVEKCCEWLQAINVRVAFSAAGVTKGGTGGVPSLIHYIDQMDAKTNEKADLPDFIVVNIGQNDDAATSEDFQTGLQDCVHRIQIKRPGVLIFLMVPFSGVRKTEIQAVADSSSNAVFIDTTGWDITYTDGVHPDQNGSVHAGQKLAEFLVHYFGKSYFMV